MSAHPDTAIAAIAETQLGSFTLAQATSVGFSEQQVYGFVASGRWRKRHPGVLAIAGHPSSFAADLWAAHLAAGRNTIVSHEAAAEARGLAGVRRGQLTLCAPHGEHHRVRGVTVHQSVDLPLDEEWVDRSTIPGLPMTKPARTVLDLAAVLRPSRLRAVLDQNRTARRLDLVEVGTCLRHFARRGKPGVRLLATVLDELTGEEAIGASELEAALLRLLRAHGLPSPQVQLAHPGRQIVGGCVDAAYAQEKLIIEADGRRWHTRVQDLRRDHERDGAAAREGWLTLRLLHEHIVGDPDGTARTVRQVLAVRRAQLGLAA